MTIHFSYNRKDVIQALRYHFLSRPEIRVMIIVVNVFALMSAILFYMNRATPLAFLIGSLTWFVLMTVFWLLLPLTVYRRNDTFRDHFTMAFGDQGFTLGNERGERPFAWSKLSKFMETPGFFYLYFDPRSFFLVPKGSLKDSDEVYELRQIFKEKIGK
ncbi:YcxB family protein [Flaviaesturariibacter flavus]|uniref:YcxB family protein n=1 Tax=Flaviaesturariibacter flavus TaxID=2502780 RepID=A0A4R1B552_9BACT|nr:YcxB family protein [Flaviaesturariibacter flavus]TCJ13254.1 YcxB family protein [Flaviaesturariibacter flavus]